MQASIQEELTTIIQAISLNAKTEPLFLFGSWAYEEPKQNSNWDIYLVIPDSNIDFADEDL